MITKPSAAASDPNDEIAAWALKLQEAQQRLQQLTGGIDSVLYPGGQSYLLQQAQEKLRRSAEAQSQLASTLITILNAIPAHVALLDSRGVIISVNENWRHFATANALQGPEFGVDQNYVEICERAVGECAEDSHAAARGIRQVLRREAKEFSMEYPCHSPKEKRWFRLEVNPVRESSLSGAVVMHIDITARKLAEASLVESEERFRSMFTAAATGIAISTPQGQYLQANEAYCRMIGYTLNELLELNFADLTHPDDLTLNLKMRDELLAGRRENFVMEKRYLKKSGDIVWTRHSVSATHTVGGEIANLIVVVEDITKAKEAEQQLLSKTALLEAQLNSTLDGVIVIDAEGRKILHNQRILDLWKLPPEIADARENEKRLEWMARQVKEPQAFLEKIAWLYAHPTETSLDELELVDGRFLERYSAPVLDKQGKYYGRIWVSRDITERKVAEKALTEQVELISMASLVGKLGAWSAEYPGPKLVWSKEIHAIYELEAGVKIEEQSALTYFLPGSRAKLEAAIASGQPFDLELEIVTAKGNRRWVRSTSAVEMKDGKLRRFYGILQDVTEHKRTQSRFRRLIDSNAQSVFFWNTEGEILDANDAFLNLVGYSREDVKAGRVSWTAMTPPEYAERDRQSLEEVVAKGVSTSYEKEFIRKDGSRAPILIGAATFEDNPKEGVCFAIDLTERKKIEQQFLRAQRMESIGILAGGVAHDLNNILAPIMMSIEILKSMSNQPQVRELLETLEVSTKRGADIVRQVLSFARGLDGQRIEVQPKHLLKDLENIIRDTFPKDIEMRFSIPGDTWTMLGDPTQVHQILLNLCVNARDAMPRGGCLSVEVENSVLDEQYSAMNLQAKVGRYVKISVTDTGTGIPKNIIDKIFEPFFTTKEQNKGTGLGLSTVMAIVKSHEGIINVYSEPGKGTTFKVYLPAMAISAEKSEQQSKQIALPRGKGETILVADDEASILVITKQTLEAFGYRVLTARDGAEAVAIYAEKKNEIAVVLTDMMMPVMDGTNVIRVLTRINPTIKIVAASGLSTNGSGDKVPGTGIKSFLVKPYTADTLLKTLRTVVDEA
jgi:PAS domain S-box-containing protein